MYKKIKPNKTTIKVNEGYKGERIEQKVRRISTNKEPIKDGAPIVYTERKEGVKPEYDIRTDRFEIAVEGMDKVYKSNIAKRDSLGAEALENMKKESGKPESIQATENQSNQN